MAYYRVSFKDCERLVKGCDLSEAEVKHGEILRIGPTCDIPDIFESQKKSNPIFIDRYIERHVPTVPQWPYQTWITCNGTTATNVVAYRSSLTLEAK